MPELDEASQWKEINFPTFIVALSQKVIAALATMASGEIEYEGRLTVRVNNVPIRFMSQGDDAIVHVGQRTGGQPFYIITAPKLWMQGIAESGQGVA